MSASTSGLIVDAQGKLTILSQGDLNALLRTTGQDVPDARHIVRDLVIKYVNDTPEDWPSLPCLQYLKITISGTLHLKRFPRTLHASALPALERLVLRSRYSQTQLWARSALDKGAFSSS